ncbi:penicillin-binding protein 2 [Endozoicomonas sp. SCSIO W0465]|uniref:peptidoglycan D,D-transpeptidase FtsI family protein n=1 Tax=Endozoicomonas sp. SCSIO W0465 TaxID=2918516 RepID=UPI0020762D65|nr:penicillin-binding transpeptidase domain-containing protein [Endozoicomonas sp. SCSIO W0465]USE34882.1 penicillin-binding protein 2 [Endozoicomonas sp. SCSIO W0465]
MIQGRTRGQKVSQRNRLAAESKVGKGRVLIGSAVNRLIRKWRLKMLQSVLLIAGLALGYRIIDLQLLDRQFLQNEGDKRSVRYESIAAHRGVIFDRNGDPLAVSTPVVTIWADPEVLHQASDRWQMLARELGVSYKWLSDRVQAARTRDFIYLKRQLTPEQGAKVMALRVPGVRAINEHRRYYPAAEVTAHLVGFTNIDESGQEGLELAYNEWLSGEPGQRRVLKDRKGQLARQAELMKSASPGKELMLSIDLRLQYMAYRELKKAVELNKAKAGSLIMLDVKTGEVLAMVNQPAYNPNNRADMQAHKMRNRVVTDMVEPGSTLKPFAVAAALESGQFHKGSVINTAPGYLRLGRDQVKDIRNYGAIDVTTVLRKSSNVGVSKMALAIGPDKVLDLLQRVGLGQSTGTGFPGENPGYLPFRDRWSDIEIATLSFGYGLTVTPLQLAQAYTVLGSGGIMRPVSLIKRDVVPDGIRVMDQQVADDLRKMLREVVHGGTGGRAMIDAFEVGGKTGTARKVGPNGYMKDRYTGMFAGLAPIDNPQLAMVVIIDDPTGEHYYGGLTAAPVFSRVAAGALRLLGVEPAESGNPGSDQRMAFIPYVPDLDDKNLDSGGSTPMNEG